MWWVCQDETRCNTKNVFSLKACLNYLFYVTFFIYFEKFQWNLIINVKNYIPLVIVKRGRRELRGRSWSRLIFHLNDQEITASFHSKMCLASGTWFHPFFQIDFQLKDWVYSWMLDVYLQQIKIPSSYKLSHKILI